MGLETATYITDLVATNPVGATDPKSQGDDHLRLIKSVLQNTFPNFNSSVEKSSDVLNAVLAGLYEDDTTTNAALPSLELRKVYGTGKNNGNLGPAFSFSFDNNNDAIVTGFQIDSTIDDITAASEDATIHLRSMIGGQLVDRIVLGANGISFPNDTVGFASGTVAFFNNSAAPAGWTADTTLDGSNGILRVVSPDTWVEDQGGTADFASVFTAQTPAGSISSVTSTGTIAAHVLAQSEIPSHTHGVSGTTGTESADHVHNVQGSTGTESAAHSHAVPFSSGSAGSGNWSNTQSGTGADHTVQSGGESANHTHAFNVNSGGRSAAHTHSFSVTSAATGGGTGHTHGLTMAAHDHTFTGTEMSFDVKHHMVLRCVKN